MVSAKTLVKFFKTLFSGKNKFALAGLLVLLVVVYAAVGPLNLLSTVNLSYSNAYEGAKPSFAGVTYKGVAYTSNTNNPYYLNNGVSFSFKGDGPSSQYSGLPKIVGEMTSVFIPQNTNAGDLPAFFDVGGVRVINPFVSSFSLINNPYKTYLWNISRGSSTTLYQMEEWKTKFYVSISANPDGSQVPFANSEWDQNNGRYSDVTVWIKMDTAPTWYFEGQDKAYFAIAQIQLAGISYKGHDADGNVQNSHNTQLIAVNPSSPSSIVTLFLNNFGEGSSQPATPTQIYTYKGATLNPQYFGNAVYFPITLNNFGSQSWGIPYIDWKAQGDVVTFDFTVTQFVVGEWTVQNIQQVPSNYGRQSSYSEYGVSGVFEGIAAFLSNPFVSLAILGVIIIVIIALIAIFLPEVLISINSLLRSRNRR